MKTHSSRGTKIYANDLGHMRKMAAMPIYGSNPLQKQKVNDLVTCYVVLGQVCLNNDSSFLFLN